MKFREIVESTITDWMKIIRAEHGKDVKFEKAELDCTVAMKDGKCVGTFDRKQGTPVKEDAELAKKIVRGQKYGPGLGNKLSQWFSDLMISRDKRRFLPSKVAVDQLKRTGFSDEQISLIRDAAVKAAYEVIERLKRQFPDRVPAKYVSQLPSSFAVFDLFLNVDDEMHEKYVQQLAKLFDIKIAKLAGQLKLKEDATTDKWRSRMYELRALQKERPLTKKELDELFHLEDLVIHDKRGMRESFMVMGRVSGGVTGTREAPVKSGGKVLRFDSKDEAEEYAAHMRSQMGKNTATRFHYWVEPLNEDLNEDWGSSDWSVLFNSIKRDIDSGMTADEALELAASFYADGMGYDDTEDAIRSVLRVAKARKHDWVSKVRRYRNLMEAAEPLRTNFVPSLETAIRTALKADSVNIAPIGKSKDTFSINVIFSKPAGNLDDNKVWSVARKHANRDATVTFNSPRKFGSGIVFMGKLTFHGALKEADEVRFSSGRKVGLDKWLNDMGAGDKTKKKKPVKKYENKPWPKMKVPGVVVSAGQGMRDRLEKAIEELGINIEHAGYSGGSTLWTVGFYPKKGFNIEKFEDDLRDKLNFDGWLEVEFEDFHEPLPGED